MPRSYNRRSAEEQVADIQRRIEELKHKQAAREKKSDPVLREMQKLQRQLKSFVQLALNHNRPDVANSALGFKAMLERILSTELGVESTRGGAADDEDE